MKSLKTIAYEINTQAAEHPMGDFQEIRRQIHGLSRVKTREIFSSQTIHKDWAFHSGGRSELQFNIGFEDLLKGRMFRYGVAFSVEASQTLPDPVSFWDPRFKD